MKRTHLFASLLPLAPALALYLGLSWTTVMLLLVLVFALQYAVQASTRDPYGSFHLSLNATKPSEEAHPPTEWLNMGYWKDADTFPQACEALALKVIEAAHCKPRGRVLDVGHGSGDSLLLYLQHPSVPRPSLLVGITSLREHHERALCRTQLARREYPASETVVELYLGDAVYIPPVPDVIIYDSYTANNSDKEEQHPFASSDAAHSQYTSITAIDCAYHFRPRRTFLAQSLARLAPGGRIALADICFSPSTPFWVIHLIAMLGVIPKENMLTPDAYVREMHELGYADVRLEDVTDDVFPGFTRFLSSRGLAWRLFAQGVRLLSVAGARFVVVSGSRPVISTAS